ncbi:hypothetical protein BJ508DRAFT_308710 [Ascobolus immersus RN42]|uniref:Uncharacterized protein n=1 Tax=Ascobolus immersus RN42 TaxID=1160509 RepID=A0A3N4HZ66_ASCIM|nr:hypothetical protein BJ508DRAFT_308710 [Ascobolus immersus RN42]
MGFLVFPNPHQPRLSGSYTNPERADPTPTSRERNLHQPRGTWDPTPTSRERDSTPTRGTWDSTPTSRERDSTPTRGTWDPTPTRGTWDPTPTRGTLYTKGHCSLRNASIVAN